MTDQELLKLQDPIGLSNEDAVKWKNVRKRAIDTQKIYNQQFEEQVNYEELHARLVKAKWERKHYGLELMKGFVETEKYLPIYNEVALTVSQRMSKVIEPLSVKEDVVMENNEIN